MCFSAEARDKSARNKSVIHYIDSATARRILRSLTLAATWRHWHRHATVTHSSHTASFWKIRITIENEKKKLGKHETNCHLGVNNSLHYLDTFAFLIGICNQIIIDDDCQRSIFNDQWRYPSVTPVPSRLIVTVRGVDCHQQTQACCTKRLCLIDHHINRPLAFFSRNKSISFAPPPFRPHQNC